MSMSAVMVKKVNQVKSAGQIKQVKSAGYIFHYSEQAHHIIYGSLKSKTAFQPLNCPKIPFDPSFTVTKPLWVAP